MIQDVCIVLPVYTMVYTCRYIIHYIKFTGIIYLVYMKMRLIRLRSAPLDKIIKLFLSFLEETNLIDLQCKKCLIFEIAMKLVTYIGEQLPKVSLL